MLLVWTGLINTVQFQQCTETKLRKLGENDEIIGSIKSCRARFSALISGGQRWFLLSHFAALSLVLGGEAERHAHRGSPRDRFYRLLIATDAISFGSMRNCKISVRYKSAVPLAEWHEVHIKSSQVKSVYLAAKVAE